MSITDDAFRHTGSFIDKFLPDTENGQMWKTVFEIEFTDTKWVIHTSSSGDLPWNDHV